MSIEVHREWDATRTDQQAPGLVSNEHELPFLHRAARRLEGEQVFARRQIDFLIIPRFACGLGLFIEGDSLARGRGDRASEKRCTITPRMAN